jgi:hypothetical protein
MDLSPLLAAGFFFNFFWCAGQILREFAGSGSVFTQTLDLPYNFRAPI